ncbi:GNAT family N-acetyltransferase [Frankia sp. R82]|uniref:GNAT family N-acetyltransferase n=1 Tax=Frankia sp. R82 TaxID=2950553 RepID=UPI002044B068|nr:GNAT family N-acetyltransferase [Frankia sp. R82]MCM3886638.1 GNAT family N-acetyltransferase [Frankia sp. R82]
MGSDRVAGGLVVRPATVADVAALGTLNAAVQTLHVRAQPAEFTTPDATAAASFFQARLAEPHVLVLLAEQDGQGIGYLYAEEQHREGDAFTRPSNGLYIHHLGTRADWRRRGVGRTLMGAAQQHAAHRKLDVLRLSTGSFNVDAQRFFASLGYEPYSIRLIRRL